MAIERTLVLIKPDGVARGLMGEIISRFERKGFKIIAMKMLRFDEELVARHYVEHVDKPFYPRLKEFTMSGPAVAMVVEADEAVAVVRLMMGATKFTEALPGTIRGDYAFSMPANLVHGSDSVASAQREIPLYFQDLD